MAMKIKFDSVGDDINMQLKTIIEHMRKKPGPGLCCHLQDKKKNINSFYKKETPQREQSYIKELKPKIKTEYRGFLSSTEIENFWHVQVLKTLKCLKPHKNCH